MWQIHWISLCVILSFRQTNIPFTKNCQRATHRMKSENPTEKRELLYLQGGNLVGRLGDTWLRINLSLLWIYTVFVQRGWMKWRIRSQIHRKKQGTFFSEEICKLLHIWKTVILYGEERENWDVHTHTSFIYGVSLGWELGSPKTLSKALDTQQSGY